ncbi:cell division protein FtsA [Ketogulonicigenium vulgare]|uniref:cell division protein FtsA n=1 Tax=Ketogulonicigenium vulgare TaxID=92945 RepID=UPI0002DF20D5|nr:cell division protein FtsA [Ketogulonicigenium vulgare]ALJ81457.1 cell division protein FtsA [Ketogulonicigenium vulgare]ANW34172.1 cell division protein FtsA [Ketogulonicigenium vulgare]AOZ55058.1 UDP-N-acetylmuramate--L-alanine ligase [Ketogulonicigenium vulgare]
MTDLYQNQRAMRHMRTVALQRGYVAVLDIGTSKIACLILKIGAPRRGDLSDSVGALGGQNAIRVIGAATTRSRGVRFGEINALAETEKAIRTVITSAQTEAQMRVDHVIACFSGAQPRSYGLEGAVDLAGKTVDEGDVGRVLAACEVPDFGDGRNVLHAQPVNFSLDHRSGLSDPRGQAGSKLATDMHVVTVDGAVVDSVLRAISRCHLECAGIASSAYVAGLASLVEDEQELGGACIDMGGGSTGISIFMRKHMIYADAVRMGGDHVTGDIAMGLQVSMAQAERIKTVHGGVVATGRDDREMIDIGGETGDWDRDSRRISRSDLIGIMRPRLEEILEEVRARLDAAWFDSLPSQSIVLTGGASQIPGLDGLATRILGQQVRLGRPLRVQGLPQGATGPDFSASVGLALFAAHPQDECWDFEIPAERYPARSLRRAMRWFQDNW